MQDLKTRNELVCGEVEGFDVQDFIKCAKVLFKSDETERALWLLNNLPAYYRDFPPKEIVALRDEIYLKLMNAREYIFNPGDLISPPDILKRTHVRMHLRGDMVYQDVLAANKQGLIPHIVDMGPGEYWLPVTLEKEGVKFTYYGIGLQEQAFKIAKEYLSSKGVWCDITPTDRPVYFNATEIIEHLEREDMIYQEFMKHCPSADHLYLSTPMYSYNNGRDLETVNGGPKAHRRAYTPNEFFQLSRDMFYTKFDLTFVPDEVMMIKGVKKK